MHCKENWHKFSDSSDKITFIGLAPDPNGMTEGDVC
jgi:hypothetical protein